MTEEALTFSELRKIQKTEKRQESLSNLDNNFFLNVSRYLERKKESATAREYKNAKRVFDKIIELRREKIVKNARIAIKSDINASELNLLPREKQLFLDVKEVFGNYSKEVDEIVNGEKEVEEVEVEKEVEENATVEDEEEAVDDGYEEVKIVSGVPEFMGTDLESYGPFEEGEQVEIPEDNAEILVNRGNAEVVE